MTRTSVALLAGCAAAALLGACGHTDLPPPVSAVGEYRLGRGDLIDVQVWKEPALSATVPVRPDGRVTLPMAGELEAAGRSTDELRREIAARLVSYVPDPQVSVMVHEIKSANFFVLGEVAHPGVYPLTGAVTVIEAMAMAGGPTEFARTGRLVVLRPGQGDAKPARYQVDLGDVVKGKAPPLPLRSGDTLYVP